ncbi:MAG: DUF2520 domain-containing protein [Bacteroidota bacterium]|nr:DUF2520 domain-containing protein [Bacteroidota bacterium]
MLEAEKKHASQEARKIVIIGCGNVAWHLAKQLYKKFDLIIYNHQANAQLAEFKKEFNALTYSSIKKIIPNADAYFICVTDSSIASVIKTTSLTPSSNVLICSGNFDLASVKTNLKNLSIFYPLQTFSKDAKIKWKDTLVVIDSVSQATFLKAQSVCLYFSKQIVQLNYQQRLKLHLAAVLVNNFTNALFVEADALMHSVRKDLHITTLLPLIKQGTKKLKYMSAKAAQTGPAKRKDQIVIDKHLEILKNNKELKQIYILLSDLITKQQK